MKRHLIEDFDSIKFEYTELTKGIKPSEFNEITNCIEFINPNEVHYRIINNDTATIEDSIEDLMETLDSFLDDDKNTNKYKIQIEIIKIHESKFFIYSPRAFLNTLPSNLGEILKKLSHIQSSSDFLVTTQASYEIPDIDWKLDKSANIPSILSENSFKPEHAHELAQALNKDHVLSNFFKLITSQYSLACLASSFSFDTPRNNYTFDGYASLVSTTDTDDNYHTSFNVIFEAYSIVFADNNFNTRLGLLRNLVSLKHVENVSEIFDDNLIKSLHSNYQIYLRENIKQYIEVKNKSIELMHSLVDKAANKFEEKQKNHQKALVGLATFYFSGFVGKIILNKNIDLLSFEFALISTFFMFFVFWFVYSSKKTLEKSRIQLTTQVNILKNRYKNILHDTEVNEIFDSQDIDNCFDESNDFISTTMYNTILIGPIFFLWAATIVNYFMSANHL